MPKKPPKFKLYWVETGDHAEDWFVVARTAREARRFHEDQEGYDPGDAVATRVKTLGDEGRTGWPSHEELVGFGLTIVQSETPRLVEYMGVRYGEDTLEHEIEVNTALREQAQRLYGVPELLFAFAVVPDLEEEEPDELADALGVAVDAVLFAHDVLDGLDGGAERHGRPLRFGQAASA